MRQRKQCTECYYIIRLKRKNPDKYYENNPNYKKCSKCVQWKTLEEFYGRGSNKTFSRCKACELEKERIYRQSTRELELSESCGSERVSKKPNTYRDKYQRECTFSIMEALGYTFNEEKGVWLKPGWKELTENGKIIFPQLVLRNKIRDYEVKEYEGRKPINFVTPEIYEKIFEMRANGDTLEKIANVLNIGATTVFKYLKGKVPKWKNTSK